MFFVFVQNQIKEVEEWFKKVKLLDFDDTMVDYYYGKYIYFVQFLFIGRIFSIVEFYQLYLWVSIFMDLVKFIGLGICKFMVND